MVKQYCVHCHNTKKKKGKVNFQEALGEQLLIRNGKLWLRALDQIKSSAQGHIDQVIDSCGFDGESAVHIGRNAPFLAIREAVEHLHPDLLVMGTVSRGNFAGFLVGNTAERLLDHVDCSLLTVKPEDFVCPVAMPAD